MNEQELDGLELYQVIDLMTGLAEQAPPSMWPQTWGWAVLGVVCLLAFAVVIYKRRQRNKRLAHRFAAIDEIKALNQDFSALQISAILKRCVLHEVPRNEISRLTSQEWQTYLNDNAPQHIQFADFYQLAYQNQQLDREKLKQHAVAWINGFKP